MVTIQLFIEGGGERGTPSSKYLAIEMRRAFKSFIRQEGIAENCFSVVRCGTRNRAFEMFTHAANANKRETTIIPLLLVDSEDAVPDNTHPWTFLQQKDGWNRPNNVLDEQVHLMAHCMETWFLADTDALEAFFGHGFNANALPKTEPIEDALKKDVLDGLNRAAKTSSKKGYDKGKHSFAILARLDPVKVQGKARWFCRLLKTMDNLLRNPHHRTCLEPVL